MKTKRKLTQTQVLEEMLLRGEIVTASSIYKETKKRTGVGSMNHHVLFRPIKEKYTIADEWVTDKNGNRYKRFWIKNLRKKK
jgi:hypothetical protein